MITAPQNQTALESKESEMMVLGCMFSNSKNLEIAADQLDENDFFSNEHKLIFSALKSLHLKGKSADVHLVSQELKYIEKLHVCGGIPYITEVAHYAGTSANLLDYIDILKEKSLSKGVLDLGIEMQKAVLNHPGSATQIIEECTARLKRLESSKGKKIPIIKATDRVKTVDEFLKKNRGKKYLGLRGEKIEEFNENLLGLRGLILLAAAPNVGKTALTVQTAIDVLKTEKDACVVYFSLEMTEQQILIRMLMHLSRLEYSTLVSGSQTQQNLDEEGNHNFYTLDEQKSLASAKKTFSEFGNRLQIIDLSICPNIDAKTAINYVEEVKQKTGCSRAFVVVDYLQVWPINSNHRLIENEVDKYRIGEMKKIRDALDNDPVLVISEARKPNKEDVWGGDLADVMGSARGTYTPDVVMLLSQIQPKAMATLWNAKKLPMPPVPDEYKDKADKEGLSIIAHLAKKGISICELKVPKCRDGMKKFTTFLTFHFTKNEFKSTSPDWGEFKEPASSKSHF